MLILPETSYCTRLHIACVQMQENRKFFIRQVSICISESKARSHWWPSDSVGHADYCSKRKELESKHMHVLCSVHKVCSDYCDTDWPPCPLLPLYPFTTTSLPFLWICTTSYCRPISYIPLTFVATLLPFCCIACALHQGIVYKY
jgi:hypothetical protein